MRFGVCPHHHERTARLSRPPDRRARRYSEGGKYGRPGTRPAVGKMPPRAGSGGGKRSRSVRPWPVCQKRLRRIARKPETSLPRRARGKNLRDRRTSAASLTGPSSPLPARLPDRSEGVADHAHRQLRDLGGTEFAGVGQQAFAPSLHPQDEFGDRDVRQSFDPVADLGVHGVDTAVEFDVTRLASRP